MSHSTLLPETPLVISPSLAATIGLEEALLLQHLNTLLQHRNTQAGQGYQWLEVARDELLEQLPFWSAVDLHRVSKSLADKGIILIVSPPLHSTETLRFALNEQAEQQTSTTSNTSTALGNNHQAAPTSNSQAAPTQNRHQASATGSASLLPPNWSPSEDLLQLLHLSNRVPREFALAQLEDFSYYWQERGETSHAWENKFRQHVLSRWRHEQQRQAEQRLNPEPKPLDSNWQPSHDALEILHRNGVNRDFIEDAIPEFVLYWRERKESAQTLNSKFVAHIRRQWSRFSSALQHDTEPHRIADSWQPTDDVYDILRLANIDISFARELIAEFVLYWKDSNQLHNSWNTKFLQHVKYHWAKRHQLAQQTSGQGKENNAGQQGHTRSGTTTSTKQRSLVEDFSDRSWAN